jgi:hypothetical protein
MKRRLELNLIFPDLRKVKNMLEIILVLVKHLRKEVLRKLLKKPKTEE